MTAPVAPMKARCAHCLDTGSLSKHMDGDLDCHYCDATEKRLALRAHLAYVTGWPQNDVTAWAAYLFAQRQAAPVAQPAQQVWHAPIGVKTLDLAHDIIRNDRVEFVNIWNQVPTGELDQFLREFLEKYAVPQLEAQQAGDVLMPLKPTPEIIKAMAESRAVDDEGEFPAMLDLLDFSGENKTRTVLEAAYVAAIAQGKKA